MQGSLRTKPVVRKGTQRWTVDDFNLVLESKLDKEEQLQSPEFYCAGHKWTMVLVGNFEPLPDSSSGPETTAADIPRECNWVEFWLEAREQNVKAKSTFKLLSNTEEELVADVSRVDKFDKGTGIGWRKFVSRCDLECFLVGSPSLIFEVCIESIGDFVHNYEADSLRSDENLSLHMAHLFETGAHHDVSFILADGSRIPSHRGILAVQSQVMDKLFQSGMKDSKDGEVIISDVKTPVFKELLRFVYTGACCTDEVDLSELFGIAHRYNVKSLQLFCAQKMAASLASENVAERLLLAHTYSQNLLKERCLVYITSHLSEVLETSGYEQLTETCPQLLAAILESQVPPEKKNKRKNMDGERDLEDEDKSKRKRSESVLTIQKAKKLKLIDLKGELLKRSLSIAGNRSDLLSRLSIALQKESEESE